MGDRDSRPSGCSESIYSPQISNTGSSYTTELWYSVQNHSRKSYSSLDSSRSFEIRDSKRHRLRGSKLQTQATPFPAPFAVHVWLPSRLRNPLNTRLHWNITSQITVRCSLWFYHYVGGRGIAVAHFATFALLPNIVHGLSAIRD